MLVSKRVCTVPFSQEVANGSLVQSLLFVKKLSHRLCSPFQQAIVNQVMDTLKEGEYLEIKSIQIRNLYFILCRMVAQSF